MQRIGFSLVAASRCQKCFIVKHSSISIPTQYLVMHSKPFIFAVVNISDEAMAWAMSHSKNKHGSSHNRTVFNEHTLIMSGRK